tara:strand:- start:35164 stop:36027 length:864 start_codon:yes stop_codon:yes gene_type:complete
MATFYTELKELRKSKGISLEQIHERTKINIRYLEAIEAGDFDILPIPYLRLFLRAYSDEIGGDADSALEQLDSFLGKPLGIPAAATTKVTMDIPKQSENKIEDQFEDNRAFSFEQLLPNYSDLKIRQDLIKAGILLVIFIFVIVVSQKIFNQDSSINIGENGDILPKKIKVFTNEELISSYQQDDYREELLPTSAPFTIKLIPRKGNAFVFKSGSSTFIEYILIAGNEKTLKKFSNQSELIFSHTQDLSIYVNGYTISTNDHEFPVKLIIKPTNPPSLVVQRFRPLQ